MSWLLLLVPSVPGLVVVFLLLAAALEERTLAPRPAVVRAAPSGRGVDRTAADPHP